MKNVFYLLSFSMAGVKNIKEKITIDFYKKTIEKDFTGKGYNVKAIYGENGSGKTAVVTAVDLLKKLMIEENYLSDSVNQRYLDEIINKRNKEFDCTCEFLVKIEDMIQLFKYSIKLNKDKTGKYQIAHEQLSAKARTGSAYGNIFECNNGEISRINCSPESETMIKNKTANVLNRKSLIAHAFFMNSAIDDSRFKAAIATAFAFSIYINTYLDSADQHDMYFLLKTIEELKSNEKMMDELVNNQLQNIDRIIGVRDRYIRKADYTQYKNRVNRLSEFLQMFKPDLRGITIEKKDFDKEFYDCALVLNYEEYSIDKEFESTGIKRLIDLFDCFNYAADGKIVFIDEMDANINDVYLCKLVEFFMEYGEGQLCFTTHNTSPMSVLRSNKKSIDFLTNDNRIVPWKTNGNYSPENLYRSGMIEYLPFNIESTDFVGLLGGDDD